MARTIIAAEIGYKDVSVSPNTTGTIYVASEAFVSKSTDSYPNVYFEGRLEGQVSYKVELSTGFWGGNSSVGVGAVEVINDDGGLDGWLNLEFRDKSIVIKEHTEGASYDTATTLINAIIERMDVVSEKRLRFIIRDPIAPLVKPMTTDVYSGNDADGVLKPIAFGQPELVKPVLIDEATLEYACTDTTLTSIVEVYDQGVAVDYAPTATGFKLVTAPSGKVTATVISSGTGSDPVLTESASEYLVSGEGRSLECFTSGASPETSLDYATAPLASSSRASASGGKYYFEMLVEGIHQPTSTESPTTYGGVAFDVAVGITNTTISNPQTPKGAGLYCLSVGTQYAGAAIGAEYNTYINDTATDSIDYLNHNPLNEVIGVKVDFDAMTIDFLRANSTSYDASSPLSTLTGPFSIAAGTYTPIVSAGGRNSTNIANIRLIAGDFTYALPSGYSAWADGITSDSTFSKLTQSITGRLSGVSFDMVSVNTIDALVHSSPEVAYTYGYYLDRSYNASRLLTDALTSIGGYWFVNRLGKVQVGQLTAPSTSVLTIDDTQIISDIEIRPDNARGLSNGLGAKKNWSPYRESEVSGSATEVFKQQITRDYQFEYRSATAMATPYEHADGAPMPTSLLIQSAAVTQEADRWATLYSTARSFYSVTIPLNSVTYSDVIDDIGQTYTVKSDRYGLSGGLDAVLVGVKADFLDNRIDLTLWGAAPYVDVAPPPSYTPVYSITDPTDISNLALWLDGSDVTTILANAGTQPFGLGTTQVAADNQGVGCWADKSGNSYHMNQTDSGLYEPKYFTNVQNGLSAIYGDSGLTYYLFSTSSVLTQDSNITVFYVGNVITDDTLGTVYANSNTTNTRLACYIDARTANRVASNLRDSTGTNVTTNPADIGTEFNQFTTLVTGGVVTPRLNGTEGTADTIDGNGITSNDYTRIFNDFSASFCLTGYICELVIYDAALTSEQITAVEAYLKAKWNTP